jgi:peptidyl-prolyl cis-trans isomerase SurA
MRLTILFAPLLALAALMAGPVAAQQNLFAPRVIVNDRVITNFEIQQRRSFLALLGAPGDLDAEAEARLIEERLQIDVAERMGIEPTAEQISAGMTEFAGRAELSAEEFVEILNEVGIATETFVDFVRAGVVWREVVRARFAPRVNISEAEIDRALALMNQTGPVRVRVGEIVLQATPDTEEEVLALAQRIQGARSEGAFAAIAQQSSVAESAPEGGNLGWLPVVNLPPGVLPILLQLPNGGVTPPIPLGAGRVGLYQMRGVQEAAQITPASTSVDYMQVLLPGGRSASAQAEAARLSAQSDTCNDIYGLTRNLPESQVIRTTSALSEVPNDIAMELARLDRNEVSTGLTRGDALVFLMLCHRQVFTDVAPSRDGVRQQLISQQVSQRADLYLQELRADAFIQYP